MGVAVKRTPKRITVTLTAAEARWLLFAAGNLMHDPQAAKGWMGFGGHWAAERAMQKIEAALYPVLKTPQK